MFFYFKLELGLMMVLGYKIEKNMDVMEINGFVCLYFQFKKYFIMFIHRSNNFFPIYSMVH